MTLGQLHLASAFAALLIGAYVFLGTRKGTRLHRRAGWAYVVAMLALNVTALLIYELFGGFGPFHVAAVASLVTTLFGVVAARALRRERRARQRPAGGTDYAGHHYMWMSYSYLGLVAAAVAETATRVPAFQPAPGQGAVFGTVVALASIGVFVVGNRIVKRRMAASLAPFRGTE
jgi:uncharacterized membrane protein